MARLRTSALSRRALLITSVVLLIVGGVLLVWLIGGMR